MEAQENRMRNNVENIIKIYRFLEEYGEALGLDLKGRWPDVLSMEPPFHQENNEELTSMLHHLLERARTDPGLPNPAIENNEEIIRNFLRWVNEGDVYSKWPKLKALEKSKLLKFICDILQQNKAVDRYKLEKYGHAPPPSLPSARSNSIGNGCGCNGSGDVPPSPPLLESEFSAEIFVPHAIGERDEYKKFIVLGLCYCFILILAFLLPLYFAPDVEIMK